MPVIKNQVNVSKDWLDFLDSIKESQKKGGVWYGRYPYFDGTKPMGMWMLMGKEDIPTNWEYRKHGSSIIYRMETDPDADWETITKALEQGIDVNKRTARTEELCKEMDSSISNI
mgnify:CR=1 FL=1